MAPSLANQVQNLGAVLSDTFDHPMHIYSKTKSTEASSQTFVISLLLPTLQSSTIVQTSSTLWRAARMTDQLSPLQCTLYVPFSKFCLARLLRNFSGYSASVVPTWHLTFPHDLLQLSYSCASPPLHKPFPSKCPKASHHLRRSPSPNSPCRVLQTLWVFLSF